MKPCCVRCASVFERRKKETANVKGNSRKTREARREIAKNYPRV
jgi:hypothetical protein